jgi:hypothetical protein
MEDGMERFRRLALDLKPPNMTNRKPSHFDSHILKFFEVNQ